MFVISGLSGLRLGCIYAEELRLAIRTYDADSVVIFLVYRHPFEGFREYNLPGPCC